MRVRGLVSLAFVGIMSGSASAGGAAGAPPPPAPAGFDELAAGAIRLERADLAGYVWALTAACDQGDDLAQRQCRIVRDARAAQLAGQKLLVDGDGAAFTVGAWDDAKKSMPLTLRGCIACAAPLEAGAGGKRYFVVGNKPPPPVVVDGVLQATPIHETARAFDGEAAAVAWKTERVPRLRAQFVIAVNGNPVWSRDGRDGLAVSVLGYRVYDPCDGGIVCASAGAGKVEAEPKTCGTVAAAAVEAPSTPTDEKLPDQLEPHMIQTALRPALAASQACFDTYGVAGEGKLRITIAGDGSIAAMEQTGDFVDTPTGACITKAVKAVTFPRSRKAKTTVNYPIVLR